MGLAVTIKETGLTVSFPGADNDNKGNCVQGTFVRIRAVFKSFTGALTDPAAVSFFVESESDGNEIFFMYGTGEIIRESTGIYYYDASTASHSGVFNWRVLGTSLAPGARQGSFYVTPETSGI